jgi:pterin-4a-carbinolamine dehydratase
MDVPDGWTLEDGGKALVRTFKFKDFSEAFGFLTRVALTPKSRTTTRSSPACGTASISA